MKRFCSVLSVLVLAAAAQAQPAYRWNSSLTNGIEGEAVWVDSNGNIQVSDFSSYGGSVSPWLPGSATGRTVHYMPAFFTFSGKSARWNHATVQNQQDNPNHNNGINFNIGPVAQPVIAAPALAAVGGSNWTFYVRWSQQTINSAVAKGINDPLNFTVAVFPSSRKRIDGIIQASSSHYADVPWPGAAIVTASGLKSFNPVKACRVDLIFGGKETGLQGSQGKKYTAVTTSGRVWTDVNGNFIQYWDNPVNYISVECDWTFTEE